MLQLLKALSIGIAIGTVTGLTPGIHPNTVIFLSIGMLLNLPVNISVPLITSLGVTHSILNHIPAILLGIPDQESVISTLPGKKLVMQGRGFEACKTTLDGGLINSLAGIGLIPLLYFCIKPLYSTVEPVIPYLLTLALGFMIIDSKNIVKSTGIALITGILGYGVMNITSLNSSMALFPMFTGLFGFGTVIPLITENKKVQQKEEKTRMKGKTVKGSIIGIISGLIAGLLPGIGPSGTISIFSSRLKDQKEFLAALGGINTSNVIFSVIMLWLIQKPRSGVGIAVQKITEITPENITTIIGSFMIASGVAYLLGKKLLPQIFKIYNTVDQIKLLKTIVVGVTILVTGTTGITGVGILSIATGIGLIVHKTEVRKSICMSCLIIPVILFYIGI